MNIPKDIPLHFKKFAGYQWILVFYHNYLGGYFNNVEEALYCNTTYKYSIIRYLDELPKYRDKFEFLLQYENTTIPSKYNRWRQTINPLKESEIDKVIATGFEGIHIDYASQFGGLALSYKYTNMYCLLNGCFGNTYWWYSIGQMIEYDSPYLVGPYGQLVQCIYLWALYKPSKTSLYNPYKVGKQNKKYPFALFKLIF